MKWLPFFIVMISVLGSCKSRKTEAGVLQDLPRDTLLVPVDTTSGAINYDGERDSLNAIRERDSFYSIKPIVILVSDKEHNVVDKLISLVIDTSRVSSRQIPFSADEVNTYDKEQFIELTRSTYKCKGYTVKMLSNHKEDPNRIFINDRELKPGRDIDTSLCGDFFMYNMKFDPEGFRLMKFGDKEYLYLAGYVNNCNGMACGVSYHMLYDPAIHKAMLLEQFRSSEFLAGYDDVSRSPVFIHMESQDYVYRLDYFNNEGRCYHFSKAGKIEKAIDENGKQYYFRGYSRTDGYDTIKVIEGIFNSKF